MKRYNTFVFVSFLFLITSLLSCDPKTKIQNYKVQYGILNSSARRLIALRQFEDENGIQFLCVDPQTLKTYIVNNSSDSFKAHSWAEIKKEFSDSPYIKTISEATGNASKLQDAGITHTLPSEKGISLTVDLCPSKKSLDRDIFTSIISEFNKVEKPVPIALSVSGLWILHHQKDLNWIKQLIKEGKINVEWINHSYSHKFNSTYPLKENFLLEKGTDMNYEILENEKTMIANELVPSVLFRFPGLVSDKSIFEKVTQYGLITIGTDAWLAKGENAQKGSIVLIHGNGNEPVGVKDFIKLIRAEKGNIKSKNWLLFDLSETMSKEGH